jgi:hypothetical protein
LVTRQYRTDAIPLELSGILCQSQWLMSEAVVSNNC